MGGEELEGVRCGGGVRQVRVLAAINVATVGVLVLARQMCGGILFAGSPLVSIPIIFVGRPDTSKMQVGVDWVRSFVGATGHL